jgi:predicted SnoaL-like aldol condensation-catalyzing enzyme
MGVYELLIKAMEERDAKHYIEALHDDYEFVRHQTGTTMGKSKMSEMMASMMANEAVVIKEPRCIYENDEILVEHSVMDFPDGTTEAVMAVHTKKEGKIVRTETGATLIQ